ncbi:ribonucleoside-diphosphate reductase, adenosylcobalamin-dependent [Candidatus Woesebacteria bacterium CG_4_10_14_0_2_um_filter_39_14]|uniref:Vitamin B12-dependent ribonucleotide reductase n=1 Tax=Candidatus Woesebacteria bacterium CG_4_10_14_0_2_um_filter_39_14 TaxID=1975054 RepID=A0A2M7TNL7_9BACT|nr:MAG: ribonucleoside-diphosphate reductase, adenosylcobalamin-dependent [Candidatus Woesebacteria bacterium CG_4_10_14_0_2_um_filter_39_14]
MPKIPKDLKKGVWTEQAVKVLEERYLKKDNNGKTIETPEEMCWRVSWEVASAEARWGKTKKEILETAKDYYNLLVKHEFLPNSPTLMNAGTGNNLQYSACFVIPVEDSIEGIFDALKYQALIHKTGGGTGFSFSRLRPHGSMVKTSSGTASGPVSFMRIFDAATNEVKQGGKRRGANMGILRVDHPDILEFIHCKEEGGITNFNISVGITDKFIEAYKEGKDYELINPKTKEVSGKLSAKLVFDEIVKSAWKTGDPGVIFIDRMNEGTSNPVPLLGPIESTNPCGEVPLYPFDSCNLGSIFLNYFVRKDPELDSVSIDWEKLGEVTKKAIRFLDGVIEVNPYTLPQIRQTTLAIRRIGLGVGGWADLLVELGVPYDSEEALSLGEKLMSFVNEKAKEESYELAKERGPFPLWQESIYKDEAPRRNSTVTTIAPTGTISIIAGASSGIEPLFAIAYEHIVRDRHLDRKLTFVNPKFEEVLKEKGVWSDEIKNKVAKEGVVRAIAEVPEDIRKIFGTAHEIDPIWHIKMQAAFQKYTENAVSKTINLKHGSKEEDIKNAYLSAWDIGCKGMTIFRDGSKSAQVLNLGLNDKKEKNGEIKEVFQEPLITRPFRVSGSTYRITTPMGTAFITINENERKEPIELFVNIGKAGSDLAAMAEALGRTISTAFRFRGDLPPKERAKEIALQLSGIGGRRSVGFGPAKILSLPDAVSIALSCHYSFKINGNGVLPSGTVSTVRATQHQETGASLDPAAVAISLSETHIGDICPSCGSSTLVYEEGCSKCHACGHSEC